MPPRARSRHPFDVERNVPLAPRTSFRLGGMAERFSAPTSESDLRDLLLLAVQGGLGIEILGGGSNLLIADSGVRGLVIAPEIRGVRVLSERGDAITLRIGAGEILDDLVRNTVDRGWQGLECLSGIPGMVGAVPVQNVGAYGQEVSDVVIGVRALSRVSGNLREFTRDECQFGYRTSYFKNAGIDAWVIVSVDFRLERGGGPRALYPEVARRLAELRCDITLASIRREVLALRAQKSMLALPDEPNGKSAGSFFTNPIVTPVEGGVLERRVARRKPDADGNGYEEAGPMPKYPQSDGRWKLSAAWLIEQSGYRKGDVGPRGGIALSTHHALCIVHRGGGTAHEVVQFAQDIQRTVRDTTGIELEAEPRFWGFSDDELGPLAHPAGRA